MAVYKYYSSAQHNFDAIENHYFYFSKAEKLNDPFDVSLKLINRSPNFKALIKKLYPKEYKTFSDEYGTCSFSKDGLNKPMWASYADNYRGFVVEYDDNKFEEITQNLCMPVPYFDVNYVDECPNLDVKDIKIPYRNIGEEVTQYFTLNDDSIKDPKKLDKVFQYLWSIKEKDGWIHEKEMRMFLGNIPTTYHSNHIEYCENGYKVPFPQKCLTKIIIGNNMEKQNIERMNKIKQLYGLQDLHIVRMSEVPFNLEIVPFQK